MAAEQITGLVVVAEFEDGPLNSDEVIALASAMGRVPGVADCTIYACDQPGDLEALRLHLEPVTEESTSDD